MRSDQSPSSLRSPLCPCFPRGNRGGEGVTPVSDFLKGKIKTPARRFLTFQQDKKNLDECCFMWTRYPCTSEYVEKPIFVKTGDILLATSASIYVRVFGVHSLPSPNSLNVSPPRRGRVTAHPSLLPLPSELARMTWPHEPQTPHPQLSTLNPQPSTPSP